MAYSYYYVEAHPISRVKRFFSVAQAQEAHRAMWTWKADNPQRMLEQWPGFISNGGDIPIGFMYKFTCDLTKDKLGVRRCSECPYKWIDRATHKAIGRWHPWHWCDYPGALMSEYHRYLEEGNEARAKEIALEIANLTLSKEWEDQETMHVDRPTYEELCEKVEELENSSSAQAVKEVKERVDTIEPTVADNKSRLDSLEPVVSNNKSRLDRVEPRVDVIERTEEQMEFMREARRNVVGQ